MEYGDQWLAPDKLQHLVACFLITVLVSAFLALCRHPTLRRWSVPIGAVVSLAAGAAKEAGDEIGLWESAGGSLKDAVADVAGVVSASILLSLSKRLRHSRTGADQDRDRAVSMV